MSTMKGKLLCIVILSLALLDINGQILTCKSCYRASSLEQCTHSVVCKGDEICYMDEIITPELSIVYTSGCRSKTVCSGTITSTVLVGKRDRQRRSDVIACSRCCDTIKKPGQLDCNARLCGIKYANTISSRCYLCDSRNGFAEQGDVYRPIDCLSETSCQSDEACAVQRVDTNGIDKHIYNCFPKREECEIKPDPTVCGISNVGNAGKRASTTLCTACCGDGLCNSGSCEEVIDRLYALWKGGVLDFKTLRQNGTLLTTTLPLTTKQKITTKTTTVITLTNTPATATMPKTVTTATTITTPTNMPTTVIMPTTFTMPSTVTTSGDKPTTVTTPTNISTTVTTPTTITKSTNATKPVIASLTTNATPTTAITALLTAIIPTTLRTPSTTPAATTIIKTPLTALQTISTIRTTSTTDSLTTTTREITTTTIPIVSTTTSIISTTTTMPLTTTITDEISNSTTTSNLNQSQANVIGQNSNDLSSNSKPTIPVPSSPNSDTPATIRQPNTTTLIG